MSDEVASEFTAGPLLATVYLTVEDDPGSYTLAHEYHNKGIALADFFIPKPQFRQSGRIGVIFDNDR